MRHRTYVTADPPPTNLLESSHLNMNVSGEIQRNQQPGKPRRYKSQKIKDDIAGLNISRQRKYQLRKRRQGLCTICGKKAFEGLVLCYEHMLKRGVHDPGKNKRLGKEMYRRREQAKNEQWNLFVDGENRWRWTKTVNEKIVASSETGFYTRQACTRSARHNGYLGR